MDNDVQNLLKLTDSSNAQLPDEPKHRLQTSVCSVRKDIDQIDSRISHQPSPDSVSLRSDKSSFLTRLEVAVSPIRDLPLEIIENILSSCVSSRVRLENLTPNNPPWSLTQICAVWRAVALALPGLWNNIAVNFPSNQAAKRAHLRHLLETFLSRTGNSTISLHITAHDPVDSYQPFIHYIINRVLNPHVGQLRYLGLYPAEAFLPIMRLSSEMVPALETIFLVFSEGCFSSESPGLKDEITSSFDHAGKLCRVTLRPSHSEAVHWHPTDFRFPWSQLTYLSIRNTFLDFVDGHRVLRQCTSLVSCHIAITTDDNCGATLPPTLLPNLVSLTVFTCSQYGAYGRFLQPFVLPSLRHLDIGWIYVVVWSETNITNLIRCSNPAGLQRFCSAYLSTGTVSAVLAEVPLLKELSLSFPKSESHSVDDLFTTIARGDLVPNIESLELELCEAEPWDQCYYRQWPCRITIRCRPEDAQPRFRNILVTLSKRNVLDVTFQADGLVFGVDGSVIEQ